MERSFSKYDDVLIEKLFQPAADLLAHVTGLDRLYLARALVDCASVGWILSRAQTLSTTVLGGNAAMSALHLVLLLIGLTAFISLRGLFSRVASNRSANPLRLAMRPHRGVLLALLVARLVSFEGFSLAEIADVGMLVCAAAALYLGACSARPPLHRSAGAARQAI